MTFTPLEWVVLIFAVVAVLKAIFVLGNRGVWSKFLDSLYTNHVIFSWVFLILAAVIFYYLIQEVTFVQLIAASAFTACLIAIAFLQYAHEAKTFVKKMILSPLRGMIWFYILIWLVLIVLALWEIFA